MYTKGIKNLAMIRIALSVVCLYATTVQAIPAPVVVLDPGHGGKYAGCASVTGTLFEKHVALDLVKHIAQVLTENGITVLLTRDTDTHLAEDLLLDLNKRNKMVLAARPAAFVSIHLNSTTRSASSRGFEIYVPYTPVYPQKSYQLACCVHHMVSQKMDASWAGTLGNLNVWDGGIRAAKFNVLRDLPCPAILIEVDYLSNPAVEKLFENEAHIKKNAACIAQGILEYVRPKKCT